MKKNKKLIFIILIFIILFFFIILLPTLIVNNRKSTIDKSIKYDKYLKLESKEYYNIFELQTFFKSISESENYNIIINDNKDSVFNSTLDIKVLIKDEKFKKEKYSISINDNSFNIEYSEQEFNILLNYEGKNVIHIELYNNENEIIKIIEKNIYYVIPYSKQFLDELTYNGIACHYATKEEYDKSGRFLKELGVNYVRTDFSKKIINNDDDYDYSKYDYWVNDLLDNQKINILCLINPTPYVNSEQKIEDIYNLYENISKRYSKIKKYEIINEENFIYMEENEIKWYSSLVKRIQENKNKNDILTGGVALSSSTRPYVDPFEFYSYYYFYDKNNNNKSIHVYNNKINLRIKELFKLINSNGGFDYINVTEYGATSFYDSNEKKQAIDVVKQSVLLEEYCNLRILYNLWCTTDEETVNGRYGILNNDYTPRDAYYSMKYFCQNTNGAEYIGYFKINDGILAHVYNKDGKPKMIIWTDENNAKIDIDYNGFVAYDIYGNKIENNNEVLTVTLSPIYLENISQNVYFKAINNLAVNKYNEFLNNNEIYLNESIKNKINSNISFLNSLLDKTIIDETIAKNEMEKHFSIGNDLIKMYNNGELEIEYVKLSSMLDSLNDIGNSYEDLITVSSKKIINNLKEINENVNKASDKINDGLKIDKIYPDKICKFSKDLIDKANYIYNLKEENDIKIGLINSKALHAYYLSKWSEEFSNIYIKKTLQPVIEQIITANENIKSFNNKIYSNSKVSENYNSFIKLIKNYSNYNGNRIDEVIQNQFSLLSIIIDEYIADNINISNEEVYVLIMSFIDLTNNYKKLYACYEIDDEIGLDSVQNSLNKLIDKYNDNLDTDILYLKDIIVLETDIYNNKLQSNIKSDNYLNKQGILKIVSILSSIIDNKIDLFKKEEKSKLKIVSDTDMSITTNKDVTITLLHRDNTTIINNDGKASYTFTENGKFIFKVSIKNEIYALLVTVDNIDKSKVDVGKTSEYMLDGNYIINIEKNTKVKTLVQNLIINSEHTLLRNKSEVSDKEKNVATGDVLKVGNRSYTLVVIGDINLDGDCDLKDLIILRKYLLGETELTNVQIKASDIVKDGSIDLKDLLQFRKEILK